MTFGEKIKNARKEQGLSQDALAQKLNITRRTVTSWETDRYLPRTRAAYEELARVLGLSTGYLLTDEEAFIVDSGEQFGNRGKNEARRLVSELTGLFAGGEMAEEDMDALMLAMQQAYVDAKMKNKQKYTPKKFRNRDDNKQAGGDI